MLGKGLHITSEYLTQEAKVASVMSKIEALEAENSQLKKDLIVAMDEANTIKEKAKTLSDDPGAERQLTLEKDKQLLVAKEKLKTIATKVVEAFQQTEEYHTVLFSWYYKGFELSRRHFFKHHIEVDLENLDLEEVDKEMVADKASQSTAPEGDALESASASGDVATDA